MILLAFYVNTSNMAPADVAVYMRDLQRITKNLTQETTGVHMVVVPATDQATRIECIYPRFVVADTKELKLEFLKYNESMKQLAEYIKENLTKLATKIS